MLKKPPIANLQTVGVHCNRTLRQIIYILTIICLLTTLTAHGQADSIWLSFDNVELDTTRRNVFNGAENASVKIDYYHTDGYSHKDRYWYEVVIIDSLMILNFQSPNNDDWDFIKYQKQIVLEDSIVDRLVLTMKSAGIKQKKKGIPLPPASGYTGDRLFVEITNLKLAGGTVYINLSGDETEEQYQTRIKMEMDLSSTIDGNYELVFKEIESLFSELPFLLENMVKK